MSSPAKDALRAAASIVGSLGAGHKIRRRSFNPGDLSVDMTGKVCVVTGATSGLGLAAARGLASLGATVVLVSRGRDAGGCEQAVLEVDRAAGRPGRAIHMPADMASLGDVRRLASRIAERYERVDVLLHNLGVLVDHFEISPDGIERTFATNVVGPFLLSALLLPRMVGASPSRIIHVTSALMFGARLEREALLGREARGYRAIRAYMDTKRALVDLSEVWAERLAGTGVTSNCMHPGVAETPGASRAFPLLLRASASALRTVDEGADTMLWLAVADAARRETGGLFFDRAKVPAHAVPWTRGEAGEARRLFEACEALSGVNLATILQPTQRTTEVYDAR